MSVPSALIIECFLPRINSKQGLSVPDDPPPDALPPDAVPPDALPPDSLQPDALPPDVPTPTSPKFPPSPRTPSSPKLAISPTLTPTPTLPSMTRVGSKQNISNMTRIGSSQDMTGGIPRVGSKSALFRVGSKSRLFGSNTPGMQRVSSKQVLYNVETGEEYQPDPLVVSEIFELKNGILGVLIGIGIKLIVFFSSEEKKIRSFVALSEEFFGCVKRSKMAFTPSLYNDVKVQREDDVIISNNKISIVKCSNHTGWTWAFIDYILEKSTSIFHLKLKYSRPSDFEKGFGVMQVTDELPYGDARNAAMHCMYHCDGELVQNGSSDGNNRWKETDVVSIEVNTQDSTLHFSVNGRRQPVSYSNIPPRLRYCLAEQGTFADGYHIANPNMICARYMHRMHEVKRLADSGDEVEVVSFRRFAAEPKQQLPPADVYDPDHIGYKPRVVEWNYLGKKKR